jgi:hypothetical protein
MEVVSSWEKCSNAFLAKFFLLGKTNALRNKISGFQQLTDETIAEAWERLQDYISGCLHHGMEWFIIQSFYHGLIRSAREHIDAAAGGFSSLPVLRKLINWLRRWPLTRVGMTSALRPALTRFTSLKRWTCSPPRLIFL